MFFSEMSLPIRVIYLVVRLMTGSKPLPKRAVHIVQSRASSFKRKYPLLSLSSSNSFLRLLPRLPVTSIPPFLFSFNNVLQKAVSTQNVTNPVSLPFTYFMFLDSKQYFFISHMIGPTDHLHPSLAPHFKTFQVSLICCPKRPSFSTI